MKTSKTKTKFLCGNCGYESYQWLGKCPSCEAWNSFTEEKFDAPSFSKNQIGHLTDFSSEVRQLKDMQNEEFKRFKTGIKEFDMITGGGAVSGSLILLGGAPGIGKSTLMLHISDKLSLYGPVLYISGEESPSQVKSRADRLNINKENIFLASESNLQNIAETIDKINPKFLAIDSIQTVYHPLISGYPGSPAQIRECAAEILRIAKSKNITVFLLGHITKDGDLAGPRILEHIVDVVLYFENEKQHIYRILRVFKNRFGPTNEIGIFEMTSKGLQETANPSSVFLNQRSANEAGGIITVSMEGIRPILLEVQALVTRTNFGLPRRTATGYDLNRIIILIAVLEKKLALPLEMEDIFINIAGGVKIKETAADLAAICAVISANNEIICPNDLIVFGEVGLSGETRSVSFASERLLEAQKLGFKKAIIPKSHIKNLSYKGGIEIMPVQSISETMQVLRSFVKRDFK